MDKRGNAKVIEVEFPRPNSAGAGGGGERRPELDQKRIAIASSLVSVLFLVMIANNSIWNSSEQITKSVTQNRTIASVAPMGENEAMIWQKELVSKLALSNSSSNLSARNAQKATLNDQFLFGKLRGLYSAELFQGKILSLRYQETSNVLDTPLYVEMDEILNRYKQVFPIDYSSFRLMKNSDGVRVYSLLMATKEVGQVEVKRDSFDRLLSLTFKGDH